MSLMTETRPLIALGSLPRVNLLPPEIAESARMRRVQAGLGGAVAATVVVVILLLISAGGAVSSAQSKLAAATARHAALQSETAKYDGVTAVNARAAAAQAMLTQAMGEEVRYSALLNDLSLTIPQNVWVKNLVFSQAAVADAGGLGTPGIGTVNVTGVGFSHEDVALWLESLAGQKGYADPYFSSSNEVLLGNRKTVNFSSTATLTSAAYSGRYTKPIGG